MTENEYWKYTDTLELMDAVIAVGDEKIEYGEIHPVHAKWDELYEYVFGVFPEPSSAYKLSETNVELTDEDKAELNSMNEMFGYGRERLEEKLREIPPHILEQCFPVWVARYILAFNPSPIVLQHITTWDHFHDRYGFMIIKCTGIPVEY